MYSVSAMTDPSKYLIMGYKASIPQVTTGVQCVSHETCLKVYHIKLQTKYTRGTQCCTVYE